MDDTTDALNTDSFADMLSGPDENEQPETDSQSAEAEQENSEDTAQDDAPADDAEGEGEAQDEQPETDSAKDVIELEIDGEKVALTKDEVKNGYLRMQDYTQKTQTLAKERQDQAEFVKAQMESVTQMSRELGQLHQIDATLQQYQNVDWQRLRAEDPLSYSTHLAEFNDLRARRGDVVQQIGQKQQQLTAKQAELFATQTKEAADHMAKVVPGFGEAHLRMMKEAGAKLGFTAAELERISDKRQIETIFRAARDFKNEEAQKQAVKRVAPLPTRAAKPAPASAPAAAQEVEKLKNRLAQTGSVKDFGALLSSL